MTVLERSECSILQNEFYTCFVYTELKNQQRYEKSVLSLCFGGISSYSKKTHLFNVLLIATRNFPFHFSHVTHV